MSLKKNSSRKDDLGVFSPISDASSTDFDHQMDYSNNSRPPSAGDSRPPSAPNALSKFHQSSKPIGSILKRQQNLPPATGYRGISSNGQGDVVVKRRSTADIGKVAGVFSPLNESDQSISESPQLSVQVTSRRSMSAVTSTPIIPFSLTTGGSGGGQSSNNARPPPPMISPALSTIRKEDGHVHRSENGAAAAAISSSPRMINGNQEAKKPLTVVSSIGVQATPDDFTLARSAQQLQPIQPTSSVVQTIQADFIRSVVQDCLDDFRESCNSDRHLLLGDVYRMVSRVEERIEDTIGAERSDQMRRLSEENERLRAENERLKAMRFMNFF